MSYLKTEALLFFVKGCVLRLKISPSFRPDKNEGKPIS